MTIDDLPILAICGWAGSGKTTLIEGLATRLTGKGLKVAAVKHDVRGLQVDRPGKDSDRFFRAGADVFMHGPDERFFRAHPADDKHDLAHTLHSLAARYDVVLVEGNKTAPLRKVWLLGDDQTTPPPDLTNTAAVLPRNCDRLETVLPMAESFLTEQWSRTPILGCVLIGGKSTRMGTPKHLLRKSGKTWLERTAELLEQVGESVVIAGAGEVPQELTNCVRLADVPDAEGPMSGILAAMRWAPRVSWIVAACDLPDLSADALDWLVSTRRPGVWATLPRLQGACGVEPLLACYDFRCRAMLQRQADDGNYRLSDLTSDPKVISPSVPSHLSAAWRNVNTPTPPKSS